MTVFAKFLFFIYFSSVPALFRFFVFFSLEFKVANSWYSLVKEKRVSTQLTVCEESYFFIPVMYGIYCRNNSQFAPRGIGHLISVFGTWCKRFGVGCMYVVVLWKTFNKETFHSVVSLFSAFCFPSLGSFAAAWLRSEELWTSVCQKENSYLTSTGVYSYFVNHIFVKCLHSCLIDAPSLKENVVRISFTVFSGL